MPGDRTEQATSGRREKARKEGDLLRSRELSSAAATLAGVLYLGLLRQTMMRCFRSMFGGMLEMGQAALWEQPTLHSTLDSIRDLAMSMLLPVAITMAAIAGGGAVAGILQSGGIAVNMKALGLRAERINPGHNLKNLFSLRTVSRFGKSLIPVAILAIFTIQRFGRQLTFPVLSIMRLEALSSDVFGLFVATAWLLLACGLIDFLMEWRSRESRLMMSREEMKQEFKETEGNPQTRGRIRGLQRQMRRRKVKADVAKAAVVITNPTHYAVALGFDFATMDAPRVLEKGRNLMAEEIKTEARWAGVPIIENPPLARSIYRSVEVGHAIPVDLYAAVAAILAYLYRKRVEEEVRVRRPRQAASDGHSSDANRSNSAGSLSARALEVQSGGVLVPRFEGDRG